MAADVLVCTRTWFNRREKLNMIKNALASDRKVVVFLAGTTAAAENFDAGAALQVKLTFNYLWPVPAGRACAAPGGAV